jgi:hypothetical protein
MICHDIILEGHEKSILLSGRRRKRFHPCEMLSRAVKSGKVDKAEMLKINNQQLAISNQQSSP